MSPRRIVAIAAAGAVVAGGAGAAIASVSKDTPGKADQEILDNAAKRLNVTPQKLHDALSAARDDQLDAAVKRGDLTQKQADAIKQRRDQSGVVLGPGPGGPMMLRGKHPGGVGPGPGFGLFPDLAKALGLPESKVMSALRDGKSIGDIAKAQGKSLDDVGSALKAAAKTRIDQAVTNGDLTRKQGDALLARLDKRLAHLDTLPARRFAVHGRPGGPPPPGIRPGRFAPPPGGPASPPGGVPPPGGAPPPGGPPIPG